MDWEAVKADFIERHRNSSLETWWFRRIALVLVCVGVFLMFVDNATATPSGAVTAKMAHNTVTRLKAELSEARHVESATITFNEYYGPPVGRWVWLARDTGWSWSQMPKLMYIINRESRGDDHAKNPTSTASGLLQFLAFWWDGSGPYGWTFDPFNPRKSLGYGHRLYDKQGWSPWGMN